MTYSNFIHLIHLLIYGILYQVMLCYLTRLAISTADLIHPGLTKILFMILCRNSSKLEWSDRR